MASLPEVDRALRDVLDRLHAADAGARERVGVERTLSCHVVDLGVVYSACWRDGAVRGLTTDPAEPAQVRLALGSDDLLALTEGRVALLTAWGSGRLKVDASVLDLLRLRNLL